MSLLDGGKNSRCLFGVYMNECMNTDIAAVGRAAWTVVKLKLEMIGMEVFADKLEYYHHPETGKQGVWGRWNHLQEQGVMNASCAFGDNTPCVMYGTRNDSNALESNVNKKLKVGTGMSLPYGALCNYSNNIMTSMCRNMAPMFGFSVVPDQLGEDRQTHHFKRSGSHGAETTGFSSWP